MRHAAAAAIAGAGSGSGPAMEENQHSLKDHNRRKYCFRSIGRAIRGRVVWT